MSKVVKEMLIADIRSRIGETRDLLVIDAARLDAIATNKFRLALREKSISTLTVRNSLAKRALNESGILTLDTFLEGPSTLVWGGEDIVALSKEIAKWAKELEPLDIKGGTTEGASLTSDQVDELSKSPSREELIGQIVGLALSPGARLSGALLGPSGMLAELIESISKGKEEQTVA